MDEPGQPILIRRITTPLELWSKGDIDLRGRAWQLRAADGLTCRNVVEFRFNI